MSAPAEDDGFAVLAALTAEGAAALEALQAARESLDRTLGVGEFAVKLLRIDSEPVPGRADQIRLTAQPTELALRLLAALRAWKLQFDVIRVELDHLEGSSGSGAGSAESGAPGRRPA